MNRSILTAFLATLFLMSSACGATHTQQKTKENTASEQADYHYKLATGLIYEKKPIAALKELNTSLELDSDFSKSHYLKGFIYMGRRNHAEAIVHLKRALKFEPRLFEATNALAASYMALKRWEEALEVLQDLLADPLNPTPWLAHNNAGWTHHMLRNPIKAVHHLEMAVFHNPKFCLGYYNLGLVLKKRRRFAPAKLHLEQAHKKCPRHAPILFALGDLYETIDRPEDAREVYADCQKLADGTMLAERCKTRADSIR